MPQAEEVRDEDQTQQEYRVTIRNCNSIDKATIRLRKGALNIKYGPNGLGKSTIARALSLAAEEEGVMDVLTPFKYRDRPDSPRPSVEGAEGIESVMTFDGTYVEQFVFLQDEVLKDSFEIFINTEDYREGMAEIEGMFDSLKRSFSRQEEFNDALVSFTELRDAFKLTKSGAVAKTSTGYRALSVGGKLSNIPEGLDGYKNFLHSTDPAGWITWQSKGRSYMELSDNCPFCSTASVDKETAAKVSEEYESSAVKNLSALRAVIDVLGRYFEPSCLEQLQELTTLIDGLSPEQEMFLVNLRNQLEALLEKLSALSALSFHALRDEGDIAAVVRELKIDLKYLDALNSSATRSVVDLINERLDEVEDRINEVRERVGKQRYRVRRLVEENQDAINEFLQSAGYRYFVRIEAHEDSYRMLLEHEDASGHLEAAAAHLSYGEKNAFALVLFMHHARRNEPDLVVLDDPVSSFDKTKKFAILHQLFRGDKSLRERTSLLLTHDIEPAIDIIRAGTSGLFQAAEPVVHFLKGRGGEVAERLVVAQDISTFSQVCEDNIRASTDIVVKCIYLRRLLEVHGTRNSAYDVLSSLLHVRDVPSEKDGISGLVQMGVSAISEAGSTIRQWIPEFDYDSVLAELKRPGAVEARFHATDVGYEKVQLFRILLTLNPNSFNGHSVFKKFVNETYHIENEYVMQLNPRKFEMIPEFVIATCEDLLASPGAG